MKRTTWRGLALTTSAALMIAGGATAAHAADEPSTTQARATIWNKQSAYGGVMTVRFFLYEAPAEASRIDLLADDKLVGTATEDPWTVTWDTNAYPEGPVRLTIRTFDKAGQAWAEAFDTWVDHTGPTLRVDQDGFIKAGGEVYVESKDKSGITRMELLANDVVIDTSQASNALLHWDAKAVNGPAKLAVRVYDTARNMTEYRRNVLVDNDRPVITVAPAAGSYVRGKVAVSVTGVRDASGLGIFEPSIDGSSFDSRTKAPWSSTLNSTFWRDGRHVLQWWVADRAWNVTVVDRTITIDNHVPKVAFGKAPKNKAHVSKSVKITANASDGYGVARVQLLVNGKVVATDSKAGYTFTLNPKKYGKKFTVQLRAYDRAGNTKLTEKRTYHR
jgi:hypothetical protein